MCVCCSGSDELAAASGEMCSQLIADKQMIDPSTATMLCQQFIATLEEMP